MMLVIFTSSTFNNRRQWSMNLLPRKKKICLKVCLAQQTTRR